MGSTMTKSIQLSKNRNIDYLYIYFERNATLIICYFRFAAKSKNTFQSEIQPRAKQ